MEEEKQIIEENEELMVNETIFIDDELEQPLLRDDENNNIIFESDTNYLHVDNTTPVVESVLTTTDSHEMVYKSPTGKNITEPNKFGKKYKKERQRKNKQQKKSRKASKK
jgi:hypothetical protein